jgi:uncharacterized iron-regulated membrane protein
MRRAWRRIAQFHKWLGLIVGLQVLIWTGTGLFFAVIPIETVRGEHLIREAAPAVLVAEGLVPLDRILSGQVSRAELLSLAGAPVWRLDEGGKPARLIDARSGAALSPLSAAWARRIAQSDYAGAGRIAGITLVERVPHIEYRGALPVWRVQFDDPDGTRLYIGPLTGKVAARRTSTWRVYDFLWSLHIMDYGGREDFNHPLIVVAATSALALALFGLALAFQRFRPSIQRWFKR